ncbi:MAG: ribosomal-processing cysteine protease Prp [Thermotogae bacterium]|nr:ribosomal-processing cysteine protease Prp [Thermotogota bacterium]MCP5465716.1 ribosomal-processing cysteine protease Prp [Thermotogota bacterium]HOO75262.1 ribosomal-processing cysteine protease Prp [Tepiditoga sp.]
MIKAVFSENGFEITGHALFATSGKDIVCSAVSSLSQFVGNIIKNERLGEMKVGEAYLRVKIFQKNEFSLKLEKYLESALKGIEEDYPKHLCVEVKTNEN